MWVVTPEWWQVSAVGYDPRAVEVKCWSPEAAWGLRQMLDPNPCFCSDPSTINDARANGTFHRRLGSVRSRCMFLPAAESAHERLNVTKDMKRKHEPDRF